MAQRSNYWSCSKAADWIRGTPKDGAKTAEDWDHWHVTAEQKSSVRYWIAEELLDRVQNFLWWPLDKLYDVKYYINNRWITRSHALTAHPSNIKPGDWCDFGNRFLPCLFNELVNFVEIELAWFYLVWKVEDRKKYKAPWWAFGWFRFRTWRCPEAGLAYLVWAQTLTNEEWLEPDQKHLAKPTSQAIAAQEIEQLYRWWTQVYPNRPDPMDASGWTDYCEQRRKIMGKDSYAAILGHSRTEQEHEQSRQILDKCNEIEQAYADEDEQMLIRLIKTRSSLWT